MTKTLLVQALEVTYCYYATAIRVVDGDTVQAMVDLGFSTYRVEKFRLAHINAPEMKTPEGPITKQFVIDWVAKQAKFTLLSKGQDKYGRWVAQVWGDDKTKSLNQILLDNKLAVPYM